MSVKPNLLALFPYDIWDSVFEVSLRMSKSISFDLPVYCLLKLLRADSVKMKSRLSGLYFTALRRTILHALS